jgi:benzoyl-CoA-dihydrodiol lyase
VDAVVPRSRFEATVLERAKALAAKAPAAPTASALPGVTLERLEPTVGAGGRHIAWRYVALEVDTSHRTATLTVKAPDADPPAADKLREAGSSLWSLRAFRELDDALLRLRFHFEAVGLIVLKTRGEAARILAHDRVLAAQKDSDWLAREVVLYMARVLKRLDVTARSVFAVLDPESCFAGSLLELALAADRTYMLDDPKHPVNVQVGPLSKGALPTWSGLTRLQARFLADPARAEKLAAGGEPLDASAADEAGLVTVLADDLDFDDTLRLAIEERVSLSPDGLTGMEANLRAPGPETMATKIFGRLSAWQNWIFIRPNATGERGALALYGKPERPAFDWVRT